MRTQHIRAREVVMPQHLHGVIVVGRDRVLTEPVITPNFALHQPCRFMRSL